MARLARSQLVAVDATHRTAIRSARNCGRFFASTSQCLPFRCRRASAIPIRTIDGRAVWSRRRNLLLATPLCTARMLVRIAALSSVRAGVSLNFMMGGVGISRRMAALSVRLPYHPRTFGFTSTINRLPIVGQPRNAPPNCCKRLTKRRLFARSPIGLLEQSTLGGRRGSRTANLKTAREPRRGLRRCV